MRSSSVRLPFLAAAATAGLLLLFASGDFSKQPGTASASHAGGADKFLIDMDPTGNTATSVATIQDCARINKNGVQDADEDAVDTVFADVVALNIPASHPIIAFAMSVMHGPNIVIDSGDFLLMLAAKPGSHIVLSDIDPKAPDRTILSAADQGSPVAAESGSGVLVRASLRAIAGGPSLIPLTLRGGAHVDPNNNAFPPDNSFNAYLAGPDNWLLPSSRVAIDQPCPPPLGPTDVVVTSVQTVMPPNVYAGERFSVQTIATLSNLGSGTVSSYVVLGFPGVSCGFEGGAGNPVSGPQIPAGGSVPVVFTTTVLCSTPGTVTGTPYAAAIVLDSIDTNLVNNLREGSPETVTVLPSDPDGDGVSGSADGCPGTPAGYAVDAEGCSDSQVDPDRDGVCSPGAGSGGPGACTGADNCPSVPNPGQEDTDGDGIADACESQPPIAVGGFMGLRDRGRDEPRSMDDASDPLPVATSLAGVLGAAAIAGITRLRQRRR